VVTPASTTKALDARASHRLHVGHPGIPDAEVTAEIERYIVDPGQACAYKGRHARDSCGPRASEKALGASGTPEARRAFHDVVLKGGALPLAILDEQVDDVDQEPDVGRYPIG